jgi:hypothetical protein
MLVHFTHEPVRKRETLLQPPHSVLESCYVAGDFGHVIQRHPWHFLQLEEKEVGEGGLCAFDLGREHGLAADI